MSPLGTPLAAGPRRRLHGSRARHPQGSLSLAPLLFGALALWLASGAARAQEPPLLLTTQHWPPYHALVDGEPKGIAVTALNCVLDRMSQPRRIVFLPWRRAQDEVRAGRADAFFTASQSSERDQYARLSVPIAPQTWAWYVPKDSLLSPAGEEFKRIARISALAGSNMAQWLSDSGFKIESLAPTTDQLVLMLDRRRVDAILANTRVMDYALNELQLPPTRFRRAGEIERPLGVYFAIAFLNRHPHFLGRFNAEVAKCHVGDGAT